MLIGWRRWCQSEARFFCAVCGCHIQYVLLIDNDERYLLTSLMHSLRNPSKNGCIQLYRELERWRCYAGFLLSSEENEIGWFTQLSERQMVPSIVRRPGECILMKRERKLRRQQVSPFRRQAKRREKQVKRLEVEKLSSSFSPSPDRKKTSNMP